MKKIYALATVFTLLCTSVAVHANIMKYTFKSRGSGILAGVPFTDSNFTITGIADTANRYIPSPNIYSIDNSSAYITIQNLGTYTFLTGTRISNNLDHGAVGFSRTGISPCDILDIANVPALRSWDMLTSLGPQSVEQYIYMQWQAPPVNTSGGYLSFNYNIYSATFAAEVVPETSTIISLLGGLAGLLSIKRRRV